MQFVENFFFYLCSTYTLFQRVLQTLRKIAQVLSTVFIYLIQYGPTTDPPTLSRTACGPPQRFQWPAEAFTENLQISNLLKSVWVYTCLAELLALDKVHLHKNTE